MSKRCNCGNWDDPTPCPIHEDQKLPRPEICWHTMFVVDIGRRSSNLKWFYTIAKDAIQTYESPDYDTKKQITEILAKGIAL
jgi:hypothetical protein